MAYSSYGYSATGYVEGDEVTTVTFNAVCVDLTVEPVVITTAATFSVVEGEALLIPLTATGGATEVQWNISDAADPAIYVVDNEADTISWFDNEAQTPADYVLTVTATDGQGNTDELEITVTVTAEVVEDPLPGSIATFTATVLNDRTVKMEFATSSGATSYWYKANNSVAAPVPSDNRLRLLSPATDYTIELWGVNAAGNGPIITDDVRTLDPSQTVDDTVQSVVFDETNSTVYTNAHTVVAGAEDDFLLIGVVSHSGGSNPHRINSVTFNGVSATLVKEATASAATVHTSLYSVPWGVGNAAGTYNVVVTLDLTALRCATVVKRIVKRPYSPIATYSDTSGAISQSVTLGADQVVHALTAALSSSSAVDLVPDLLGLQEDENTEGKQATLNYISAYFSSPDGETRDIGSEWVDGAGVETTLSPRMVAVVYDEQIRPQQEGIVPREADELVTQWSIDTHADWFRGEGGNNDGHGKTWHWSVHANPTLDNVIEYMGELGVRYYRMGPSLTNSRTTTNSSSQNYKYAREWYDDYGMQAYGPVGNEAMTLTKSEYETVLTSTEETLNFDGKRRFYAYEGPNEANKDRHPNWNTRIITVMNWILDHRAANYPEAKVIGPSIWGRNPWDIETLMATTGWQAVMNRVDFGTLHTYNGARKPTLSGKPLFQPGDETGGPVDIPYRQTLQEHNALYNNKPLWITETGFKRGNPQGFKGWTMPGSWVLPYASGQVTVKTYMKYILRYFMASLEINEEFGPLGVFSPYIFFDDVETQPNFCFGICYPNQAKNSLIKLPSYATIQRFLNLFKDKTFSYAAGAWQYPSGAPSLSPLNYTITGGNGLTRPIAYQQTQKGILYRKANGKYLIPLYQDEESWKRDNTSYTPSNATDFFCPADVDPTRRTVTFDAGQVVSKIEWFEPTFDNTGTYPSNGGYATTSTATARKTANNTRTMTIAVPDHVGVIQVTP